MLVAQGPKVNDRLWMTIRYGLQHCVSLCLFVCLFGFKKKQVFVVFVFLLLGVVVVVCVCVRACVCVLLLLGVSKIVLVCGGGTRGSLNNKQHSSA